MNDSRVPTRRRTGLPVSVRTRIMAVITVVTALCLLAVGVSVSLVERYRILDDVDQRLAANLESARFIVADGNPATGDWASSTEALTAVVRRMSPDDHTGALGMHDGRITIVPGMTLDLDLRDERDFAAYVDARLGDDPIIGTYAENGRAWRYLAVPISVSDSPAPATVAFVMVYDLDAELGEYGAALRMFVIASALALVIVALTSIVVATRLLRPLREMRETAKRISAESLEERLPIVGNDDVAELTATINDMLDRLDGAVDAQRRLLSDVGHELKTPLTIVRGNIELLDPNDPDEVRETSELLLDELDRMNRLVQDLGEASALYGRQPLRLEAVELAELTEQIAKKAEGIVGAEVSVSECADGAATLDAARITQAVLQLAQNAVTHGGGRVELGSRRAGHRIEFRVRDHGPGIGDEAKPLVFERFHRERGAYSRAGSGLGLSIVRMIAQAHRGDVTVEDAEGGGALFVLTVVNADDSTERKDADGIDPHRG